MLEVSFEQITLTVGGILATMAGAVGFMFRWVLNEFKSLKKKLDACEIKHTRASTELAELRGKIEVMDRHNPKDLVDAFVIAVEEIVHRKLNEERKS